jgi:hypothetical protein
MIGWFEIWIWKIVKVRFIRCSRSICLQRQIRHRVNFLLCALVTIISIRTHSRVQAFLLMFASSLMFKFFPQCLKYWSSHLFSYPSLISSTRAHIPVHSSLLSLLVDLTFMFIPLSYLQYHNSHSCSFPSLFSDTRTHIHTHTSLLSPVVGLTFMFKTFPYVSNTRNNIHIQASLLFAVLEFIFTCRTRSFSVSSNIIHFHVQEFPWISQILEISLMVPTYYLQH